ncbi:PhoX family phosphatase [Nocardioides sp. GY 10113]|uniref:PhoX family protein n=1 Tax=Nocardioides sp. GY 10113 TaxID=2569761 RepID=UPI0010A7B8A5|nr:PhoX family phosphatase [Nocardioides sp. GY 10113]TIC84869.1 PhoX family phosphatase [Nocardioides sp. GY 10113]
MSTVHPDHRTPLPLIPLEERAGHRHGSRSYLTCLYRCGNACDQPVPNPTDHPTIGEEIAKAVGRRTVLRGAAIGGGALVLSGAAGTAAAAAADVVERRAAPRRAGGPLARADFVAVPPNRNDAVGLPDGFDHDVIIRWGDPVLPGAPAFDPRALTVDAVKKQFGYNNDYVGVVPMGRDTALMVVNHEYDDITLMYPSGTYTAEEIAWLGIYTHGLSVVTIKRGRTPGSWRRETDLRKATKNRRINADTTFRLTGPAAGHDLLKTGADASGSKVKGTFNNCAGGLTPWGTILSGEENFNQYFNTPGAVPAGPTLADGTELSTSYSRYGIGQSSSDPRRWYAVDDRFDLEKEPNEPHRFGWVVEVDPMDPTSTPVKHTMLGRFKHEGANVTLSRSGRAVVYMGDDERGDYLYKFVSAERFWRGRGGRARAHNKGLLDTGTLYVARLTGDGTEDGVYDGTGEWLPLCTDTTSYVPGMTVEEVLIFTRHAADLLAPTKMDRPEDVEINPVNGKVYAALTNNSNRGASFPPDEANPITTSMVRSSPVSELTTATGNRNGYILEMTPKRGDHDRTEFTWDLLLVCGDPEAPETYFGGFPKDQVSPISCPDNVTFDSAGNLWIATDGNALGANDGLFRVPVAGPNRGQVKQFLSVPKGAECCGPLMYDGDRSLFFAPQHPGEVSGASFDAPASTWPDGGDYPRPAVCVAYRA